MDGQRPCLPAPAFFMGLRERAREAAPVLFCGDEALVIFAGLFERVLSVVVLVRRFAGLCDRPRAPAPPARRDVVAGAALVGD